MDDLHDYFRRLSELCARFDVAALAAARDSIVQCLSSGQSVFIAGNGGSAATAEHWANDLRREATLAGWAPVRVEALSVSSAQVTAQANDHGYHEIFADALRSGARAGDALVVLSASGSSLNVLEALRQAERMQLRRIGLLGSSGGQAATLCEVAVLVDSEDPCLVEDLHLACDHAITRELRRRAEATKRPIPCTQ